MKHCEEQPVPEVVADHLRQVAAEDGFAVTLHPETEKLVDTFAAALKAKLRRAQAKYGYSDNWRMDDWEADCQRELVRHVAKGDPLDVAAYAAFCWARGYSTAPAVAIGVREVERAERVLAAEMGLPFAPIGGVVDRDTAIKAIAAALAPASASIPARYTDQQRAAIAADLIGYGAIINTTGERPWWLLDGDIVARHLPMGLSERKAAYVTTWDHPFRVRADHPFYQGFGQWSLGSASIPADVERVREYLTSLAVIERVHARVCRSSAERERGTPYAVQKMREAEQHDATEAEHLKMAAALAAGPSTGGKAS